MKTYSHPRLPLPLHFHPYLRFPLPFAQPASYPLGADCYVKRRPPVIPPGLPAEYDRIVPAVRT